MEKKEYRSSFSQHWTYTHCKRWWWYLKIKNISVIGDICHADAGNVVHECLKIFYDDKTILIEKLKEKFEEKWKKKKLDNSKIKLKKDNYWMMILDGIKLDKDITTTEFKIYYPEILAFLDGISTRKNEIYDWKSSSQRNSDNENEYKYQGLLYAYLYYKKFNIIPKVIFYYLALTNSNKEYIIQPTIEDIKYIENWYYTILNDMKEIISTDKKPEKCSNCHIFCPYVGYCNKDDNDKLNFILHTYGNYIQLEGVVSELLEKGIKRKFSYELKNAYFIKKARPMAKTTVEFWNSAQHILPIGFKDSLLKTIQDYCEYKKIELNLQIIEHRKFDNTKIVMPEKFVNGKILRDYQLDAVDIFLRKKIGVLELATGSGKTEIAIECIRRLGCKTLFIVDKIELMKQTKKRIEESLGIEVGIVGYGKDIVKDVTVATIQTLNSNTFKYTEMLNNVRFVVFDECHKTSADSYVKISRYLINSEQRMGISATAFRDDKNDMKITAVAGEIIHKLNSKILIESNWLIKPQIKFYKLNIPKEEIDKWEHDCKGNDINPSRDYAVFYNKFIMNNEYRNNKILDIVNVNEGKKILILTKLIEHGIILNNLIPNSYHMHGSTPKEERNEMFKEFTEGKSNILISTISIWSEGIDMPNLDIVINTSANSGDVKSIQVLGRILRKFEGKNNAQYIDFMDESVFFRFASFKRRRILIKEGHDVDTIKLEH